MTWWTEEEKEALQEFRERRIRDAAPELLAVLKSILELQTRGYIVLGEKYTEQAKAAIDKALGEEKL